MRVKKVRMGAMCAVAVAAALSVSAFGQFSVRHLSEAKKGKWDAKAAFLSARKGSAVQLAAAAASEREARYQMKNFVFIAKDFFEDPYTDSMARQTGTTLPYYSFDSKPIVCLSKPDLVSYYFEVYEATGGNYPSQRVSCSTFASVDGKPKKLQLSDVFSDGSLHDSLNALLVPKIQKMRGERVSGAGDSPLMLGALDLKNWAVTPAGVTWIFPSDSIAAHVEGQFVVKVPWSELASMVRSDGPLGQFVR